MLQTYFDNIEIIVVLLYVVLGISLNSYLLTFAKPFRFLLAKYSGETAAKRSVYLQRFMGMFFYGIVPLVIVLILLQGTLRDYGTVLTDPSETLLWGILFAAIIIPLTLYNAKSPSNLAVYPQIRSKKWTLNTLLLSGLTWAGYLLFYEFLFRGFLLFACLREFGAVPAVAINMMIYSVAHIPKGKLETIGAIPLGLLLCVVTLATGSIWFAFLAHVIMALSNEWISLYHNKDIKLAIKF
ncbi:CPBP family intramembrane glutamic endopeptidase [Labilibaculum antarcticum]|uniref:CPBP family intramembrane metalloprotease n=1 Tax=Labilibaculum antarcticum TaxID=1717717 RepID=A0A1Y1CNJ1_9BACT|nr:CPBP family intramembrane glutamic endopeptidase [Labilibaculum antarcticum]BAX81573.1 CPBP family intramembrane metalloprotease [Labilibaculum antarcticum]